MASPAIPEFLQPYLPVRANILPSSTLSHLGKHLNVKRDTMSSSDRLQDFRGLAEELGFAPLDVSNFELKTNPTMELLKEWTIQSDATIGQLLLAIMSIERFDILNDDKIKELLERDLSAHRRIIEREERDAASRRAPVQVAEVTESENLMEVDEFVNITINEVESGVPEYFDAFVCYTPTDFPFVNEMIHKLENVHGLRLCIVNRDLVAGCAKEVVMAKLIKERCKKMIIILSPEYTQSNECDFQTRFAFSLAPGAKEKKLIPVIIKPCRIPDILNHICLLDYTKCDVIDWFWERLAKSLKKECVYMETGSQVSNTQASSNQQFTMLSYPPRDHGNTSSTSSYTSSSSLSGASYGSDAQSSEVMYPPRDFGDVIMRTHSQPNVAQISAHPPAASAQPQFQSTPAQSAATACPRFQAPTPVAENVTYFGNEPNAIRFTYATRQDTFTDMEMHPVPQPPLRTPASSNPIKKPKNPFGTHMDKFFGNKKK